MIRTRGPPAAAGGGLHRSAARYRCQLSGPEYLHQSWTSALRNVFTWGNRSATVGMKWVEGFGGGVLTALLKGDAYMITHKTK